MEFLVHRNDTISVSFQKQNAKMYKRHSSVIPSTHLMDEVKEVKPRPDGREYVPGQYWWQCLESP